MKVLIVDDSQAMRLMVKKALRQAGFTGHQYIEAINGKDALTKIDLEKPDLVLSDWNMPEMTGLELLTTLRSENNPVIFGFVTTESTGEMRAKARQAGCQFLITKPFTAESFRVHLESLLT